MGSEIKSRNGFVENECYPAELKAGKNHRFFIQGQSAYNLNKNIFLVDKETNKEVAVIGVESYRIKKIDGKVNTKGRYTIIEVIKEQNGES